MKMTWSDICVTWLTSGQQTLFHTILSPLALFDTNNTVDKLTQLTRNISSNLTQYWLIQIILFLVIVYQVKHGLHGLLKSREKINSIPTALFDMAKVAYKPEICNRLISTLTDMKSFDTNQKITLNDRRDNQMSLFQCACFSGNERILRFLLYHGADIHSRTKWDDTPLHLVAFALSANKNNNLGAAEVLLEAGCDVNCKNWIGNTPLCVAASHGNIQLVKYLLAQGANPSTSNNKGVYPIDFANNADHGEVAELLVFDVPNPYVWDVIEPHTPPKIKLGLQSPSKQHLADSTFTRRQSHMKRDKHLY